ncbi:DUF4391 domain-containing protein [Actinomyces sp.]|uniref:DUF4391 domain-containing protein n=1 Tax=Actinomyces sp. TaxID=29317 RepID=UPI0026DAC681|nr:DUF4391 domain-containing protein [Actinomyces sp.]MDO4899179.1 DUF4391 domain-containing protein [Actinomyces sp.]
MGRRLPKEAFYRNLKLDARTRDEFVHHIESITIANSIKPSTANLDDGATVHEIMVLDVRLKGDEQPMRAIEAIASANPHKLVFHTEPGGVTYVLRKGMQSSVSIDTLDLAGKNLDTAWDSICSQVIFGDANGTDVDARVDHAKRRADLEEEIAKLDAACRKARQINRKNELFAQLKARQRELRQLEAAEKGI